MSEPEPETSCVTLTVTAQESGTRLDRYLADKLDAHSRSAIKALIKAGNALVNGAVHVEPNTKVQDGTQIALTIPPPVDADPEPEDIPLDVLFEDDALIVVNKPAGMVVHPAAGNWNGTLVNALLHHCGDTLSGIGGVKRPGIVHRLDKDTSGVLVVAKTDQAHKHLSEQFASHGRDGRLQRAYQAFIWSNPAQPVGVIQTQLGRSASNRVKIAVVKSGGREAITHYRRSETFGLPDAPPVASLVTCHLETGRTHQIRVHMAHIGHPILGDGVYGSSFQASANRLPPDAKKALGRLRRQALHAQMLGFEHPGTLEKLEFSAPLPIDLDTLYQALKSWK